MIRLRSSPATQRKGSATTARNFTESRACDAATRRFFLLKSSTRAPAKKRRVEANRRRRPMPRSRRRSAVWFAVARRRRDDDEHEVGQALAVAGLNVDNGPANILCGVTRAVPARKMCSLVGRNGAGKRTTAHETK